jgi:hypothetical protein
MLSHCYLFKKIKIMFDPVAGSVHNTSPVGGTNQTKDIVQQGRDLMTNPLVQMALILSSLRVAGQSLQKM